MNTFSLNLQWPAESLQNQQLMHEHYADAEIQETLEMSQCGLGF